MTNANFLKTVKENNKKVRAEIKALQSGLTEGKNKNALMIKLLNKSTK